MTREPLKPATALFPPSAERERCENFLTYELLEANRRVAAGTVMPTFESCAFQARTRRFRLSVAAFARRSIIVDNQANGARPGSCNASALLRTIQSVASLPGAVRRSASPAHSTRNSRRQRPRQPQLKSRLMSFALSRKGWVFQRALHERWIRGELHSTNLRFDRDE
jgi:hypothetical protein